jgi:hypothetical protein
MIGAKWFGITLTVGTICCIALIFFSAFTISNRIHENRPKYTTEIRETTKECLRSVRSNPQVQNFNDDNEIVKSCTEYALNLYGAQ